jgi:hypothetical protein
MGAEGRSDEMSTTPVRDAARTAAGRATLERLMGAIEAGAVEQAAELVTDDFVMEWPQSGERFSGRDNALAALMVQDEKPELAGEPRFVGDGNVWVATMPLRYGEELYHYVGVFELRDGLIARSTEYFGAPFPAKEIRAAYRDA